MILGFTNKDKQESNCSLIITSPFSTKKISPLPPSMSPVSKNIQKSNSHSLCKVGGIYIYIKFWNLNFTLAQNLFSKIREYIKTCILKVLYSYVFDCNVIGFINTEISNRFINNHKLLSLSNLSLLFNQPLSFLDKNCTLPHLLENKKNSSHHCLCKVVTRNKAHLRMCHLLNLG